MKTILVVCPNALNRAELSRTLFASRYRILFEPHDYDATLFEHMISHRIDHMPRVYEPQKMVDRLLERCEQDKVDGVITSEDYPGSIIASSVAAESGLPAPSLRSIIVCQHKYLGRRMQADLVPEVVPPFTYVSPGPCPEVEVFPMFVKPVKGFFSLGAGVAHSRDQLADFIKTAPAPSSFFAPLRWGIYHANLPGGDHVNGFMVEQVLTGKQVTLEGIMHDGSLHLIGIVDTIIDPKMGSFTRFDYPSQLSSGVQERMTAISECFMRGIGFDQGVFNIEFMYDDERDEIFLIEVNPRMVSQFADMMEHVDGMSTYEHAIRAALGHPPCVMVAEGRYPCAASFPLRRLKNGRVIRIPSEQDIERLKSELPDVRVRIDVRPGQLLSDEVQDKQSYRYAVINLGARDRQELFEKFDLCQRLLPFEFRAV